MGVGDLIMVAITADHVDLARRAARSVSSWDVDEAEGDALLGLVLAARTWDGSTPFEGYAWTRCRWRAIEGMRLRSGRRGEKVHGPLDGRPEPRHESAEETALPELEAGEVRRALARLPQGLRQLAQASMEPGGQRALARHLGVSESTISLRKRQLRSALAPLVAA